MEETNQRHQPGEDLSEARRITVSGAMQLAGALAQAKRGVLTIESIESIEATGRNQWVVQVSPGVAVAAEITGTLKSENCKAGSERSRFARMRGSF